MDNKISFKANLISNNVVNKNVVKAFKEATKAFSEDSLVLTKGCADDGLEGSIIATMQSAKNFTGESSSLIIKAFSPFMSEESITTKLVRGFKMMVEEATMNQKKYWIEKNRERASAVVEEQTKKAELTKEKGLDFISNAYYALAKRSSKKLAELDGQVASIENKTSKKMEKIASDDKELQRFVIDIFAK